MNVLIVGSGGREHALAWKCAQSNQVETVFVAPGNAGTASEPGVKNLSIGVSDTDALIDFARNNAVGLTIIGPEAPLVAGIVDTFEEAGLACFGPSRQAAALEGSKSFCKDFLKRHNIPSADYDVFTDIDSAEAYIESRGTPIVIKADGLAAGKGVVVAQSMEQAKSALSDMLSGNKFGEAGHRVVIEDFLRGEEASFIVISDGQNVLAMATSQDHKARDEGDTGPNTGGMGAYSPAPVIDQKMHDKIMSQVILPTIAGLKQDGKVYKGFLYAGLMITPDEDIKVLEYNCRFGDPETQPIMMRLRSDLVELCLNAINGQLADITLRWDDRVALGIVAAAQGYPDDPRKGDVIEGLEVEFGEGIKIFHAGTTLQGSHVVTSGGRVLCVTALGDTVTLAQQAVLSAITQINWHGKFFRRDIGYRAIERELREKVS
jgi:phosphoribosylamine--glycine ligase